MKRLYALVLTAFMLVTTVGCGNLKSDTNANQQEETVESTYTNVSEPAQPEEILGEVEKSNPKYFEFFYFMQK